MIPMISDQGYFLVRYTACSAKADRIKSFLFLGSIARLLVRIVDLAICSTFLCFLGTRPPHVRFCCIFTASVDRKVVGVGLASCRLARVGEGWNDG